jgi:hypothetical protein
MRRRPTEGGPTWKPPRSADPTLGWLTQVGPTRQPPLQVDSLPP